MMGGRGMWGGMEGYTNVQHPLWVPHLLCSTPRLLL